MVQDAKDEIVRDALPAVWLQREMDAGANGSFNPDLKVATLQDKR